MEVKQTRWLKEMLAREFRTVAFLQNQWFKNPKVHIAMHKRHPELREQMVANALFYKCVTGKRLRNAFGDHIEEIVWENTTREIGGASSSNPKPDPEHIKGVLEKFTPHCILTFGKQAEQSVGDVIKSLPDDFFGWDAFSDWPVLIIVRHPAARPFYPHQLSDARTTWLYHREDAQ